MGLISKTYYALVLFCLSAAVCLGQDNSSSSAAGSRVRDFTCLQSHNFKVYFENKTSANEKTVEMLEGVHARFIRLMNQQGFNLKSSGQFQWYCFDDRNSYQDYSLRADGFVADRLISYYSAKTNYVAILSDGINQDKKHFTDTVNSHQISASDFSINENRAARSNIAKAMLTHELIHQLSFNTGLQKRGVEYPLWLSEGMATAFEYLFDPAMDQNNPSRLQTVMRMRRQGNLIPLSFFVSMSRLSWPELTDSEIYAQCYSFYEFLWKTRQAQLQDYLAAAWHRDGGSCHPAVLKKEFINSFGPVKKIEKDWKNWLSQKPD